MNLSRLAIAAAGAWSICVGIAHAQIGQQTTAQPASLDYYYLQTAAQPSPSDQPAAAAMQAPGCEASCGGKSSCDSCGCGCALLNWFPCGCSLEDMGEVCRLFKPCCEESQWSGAGWLAQGYVWNPYQPNDKFNGPATWNDRANEYQMNELFYYFGRAAKTDDCCLDWGARVDAMYGTSYRWNTSAGFESHWGNGQFYGLAVPQLYGEIGYNGWDVKVGRWYSPVGYYVIGTANNFFPLLPYTFQYGEPFTHTGVIATKKISDDLTVGGAITHGWDSSDNTGNPHAGGLATATYTIDDQRALAYVGVFGNEPNFSGVNLASNGFGYTSRYLQTLVYTRKFSDDVMGVLQSDFGTQHDAVVPGQTAKWYGANGYLYWNMTCRCQWGLNTEWFRDQGGFRVGGVLPSFGSPNARGLSLGRSGYDGSFYRIMFGPKYFFTPNIYTRVALAADWYDGKANNAGGLRPFDDGTKDHQQAVVFDLIALF
jgi:Putative beta-barrel porin-2, OmpL-like. bbp2